MADLPPGVLALGVHGASLWAGVDPVEGYGDYMALAVTVFVYAIGYTGLRRQALFAATPPERDEEDEENAAAPRYAKSGMDPEEARRAAA